MLRRTAQRNLRRQTSKSRGFTLVELLIVVAIIIILGSIVFIFINPFELRKRENDSIRITDLSELQQAINASVQEATQSGAPVLCVGATAPCQGKSTDTSANNRNIDGTGWVKVNLSNQKSVQLPMLPVDPINNGTYFYEYKTNAAGDAWEINATLESDERRGQMATDGGDDDGKYEKGSNLTIITP